MILPRYTRHTEAQADRTKIARILAMSGADLPAPVTRTGTYLAVDGTRLRGIPAIGPNVTGAIPGTIPHSIR